MAIKLTLENKQTNKDKPHLAGQQQRFHRLRLQFSDLGLKQVDHLLVVHLHPPGLLLGLLGQLDLGGQSATLLSSQKFQLLSTEEVERMRRSGVPS